MAGVRLVPPVPLVVRLVLLLVRLVLLLVRLVPPVPLAVRLVPGVRLVPLVVPLPLTSASRRLHHRLHRLHPRLRLVVVAGLLVLVVVAVVLLLLLLRLLRLVVLLLHPRLRLVVVAGLLVLVVVVVVVAVVLLLLRHPEPDTFARPLVDHARRLLALVGPGRAAWSQSPTDAVHLLQQLPPPAGHRQSSRRFVPVASVFHRLSAESW